MNAAGTTWSATIPSSDAITLANGTATVSAQVTDASGNPASFSQAVTVAESGPTVTTSAARPTTVVARQHGNRNVQLQRSTGFVQSVGYYGHRRYPERPSTDRTDGLDRIVYRKH